PPAGSHVPPPPAGQNPPLSGRSVADPQHQHATTTGVERPNRPTAHHPHRAAGVRHPPSDPTTCGSPLNPRRIRHPHPPSGRTGATTMGSTAQLLPGVVVGCGARRELVLAD